MRVCWIASFAAALGFCSAAQAQVALWTFETSQPTTSGPIAPESGTGVASATHAGVSTVSSPAGNGSSHSFSSNTWAIGDFYQFSASTVGNTNIKLDWDQTSSNTGPRDFQLQYSTDGTAYNNFGSVYAVLANAAPNPVWNATTFQPVFHFSVDLSSIVGLNNNPLASFRLLNTSTVSANGGTVAVAGTDRVDNFGINQPIPEPTSLALTGLAILGGWRLRRRAK